ncbi:RNA polymerase sigma-70 factor [Pedobacter sp. HMWF019]|uniref:sigma-70 family RNA polymerase sigma factor n=1 Tax=Pedobacter sp. HMWF019 TaxID=2056856 RepID=UPI000D3BA9E4|nr:sigma-70 family RNA polymerase sigma factor [Pedobacter sp. HMWF019]PTS95203.1 RNA polymerase sigma-70 factor [Pedobacter sp. HMWF019]
MPSALPDHELVLLLKEGQHTAFEELYNRYWKKILHLAVQKTGDLIEAENIVQDIFVSLWKRREVLTINSSFNNYLVVSVKYRVIKWLDKQRSKRLYEGNAIAHYDVLDDSTQQYLEFQELRSRLEKVLATLPEKSLIIYKMNKDEGMSHHQIATELGMTEKAVNSHLVRTKKVLRAHLNNFLTSFLL